MQRSRVKGSCIIRLLQSVMQVKNGTLPINEFVRKDLPSAFQLGKSLPHKLVDEATYSLNPLTLDLHLV